jgi:hypothetical protein
MQIIMICDIYFGTSPSNDSGGATNLGVLVLAGQRNGLDVVTEGERRFHLYNYLSLKIQNHLIFSDFSMV